MTDDDAYELHREMRRPHDTVNGGPPAVEPPKPFVFWPALCAMCADTGFETGTAVRCLCQVQA